MPFIRPPLDQSLTVPELYDWHYEHNRDFPFFVYEDSPGHLRRISYGEAMQGVHRATQYFREQFGDALLRQTGSNPPIVAILAASDTITFFCCLIGALRTGCTIFPISPRNSAPAAAHLLSKAKPIGIVVSSEPSLQQLADDAIETSECPELRKYDIPVFERLFPGEGFDPQFPFVPSAKLDMNSLAIIYHSSGTTSFPKPIYWTHEAAFWMASLPLSGEVDTIGSVVAVHCIAMFHAMGSLPLTFPATSGFTLAVFKPRSPATVPNPVNVFEGAIVTESEYMFSPPAFYEEWAQDKLKVKAMAKMKGVVYGGGPLAKHAGDTLARNGVNVYQTYASTETLGLSEYLPKPPGMDWDYFKFLSSKKVHLEDFGNNVFRVVTLTNENFRPLVINTKIDGVDAYASDDLVSPHPTKPGYYKVVGRADDQIMHSNGEKTNPGPLEWMLKQDPHIQDAVMFGRGRFQCGVLIQPKKDYLVNHLSTSELEEFRNAIWPTAEKVNAFAPTHSRLFKEMIIVTSPEKPFEYTPKRTLRRQRILDAYAVEIDAVYAAVEESAQTDIGTPKDWSESSVLEFVRNVVAHTMKTQKRNVQTFGDEADLFEYGLDSLQATWIRNTIMRALRESHTKLVHKISANFVYEHPTIAGLARYISSMVAGHEISEAESREARKKELLQLVNKFTQSFPGFTASTRKNQRGHIVLLTGSTGSLGSSLLARLLQSDSVAVVYALSRPSEGDIVESRLYKSFEREGMDLNLLRSGKLKALDGDPSKGEFGLGTEQYTELRSTVTHVIHNGWRVNFSNTIASFESNIKSVRNFVEFCLNCKGDVPARLIFISSIGVFQESYSEYAELEEPLPTDRIPLGNGYGESKWVAEKILNEAAKQTNLRTTIIRPGQITGGVSGSWKEHEWFPSLIRSSVTLGKLPTVDGSVSWITADTASGAIMDMLDSDERVFHIVHPHPVKWNNVMQWFSKALNIPTVSYGEWLETLEKSDVSAHSGTAADLETAFEKNPALRLLDVFRAAKNHVGEDLEPLGAQKLASEKAVRVSKTLQTAEQINEKTVESWLSYWRQARIFI
ncbi:acetyl-CoA synthetase-like protein [Fomitiporia mediterranea MF3/22]|uniref:acetyl-CoA synthetase-like protein n=1 Tax=Fomitiporia mediterranea (strain MF3/22) TaxID=694068 RepID=UPI000440933B|nr:acetyl-CoA synthetase-like protein [Fomitiporia mediterranea MF3/22]EJC99755.1 acetyl-CoA synthetase-like protein [Fomitiporia mediterranea MF3/22]